MRHALPTALQRDLAAVLSDWEAAGNVARLWNRDASLWTGKDESEWLGWLDITRRQLGRSARRAVTPVDLQNEKAHRGL